MYIGSVVGAVLLCLFLVDFPKAVDAVRDWNHPMHNVYKSKPDRVDYTPADGVTGRFLSLSKNDLIHVKRALRRVPHHNTPLAIVHRAAEMVESGQEVDISAGDIFPDPEAVILELWETDDSFREIALAYMKTATSSGGAVVLEEDEIPAPEDRDQAQGYAACVADYDAYIGPLTKRWLWDALTLRNELFPGRNMTRPPRPDDAYRFVIDATGRRPRGLFEGAFHWLGSLEECTDTIIEHNVTFGDGFVEQRKFQGKYARLDMPITVPLADNDTRALMYALGVCVPDTCSKHDVRTYLTGNADFNGSNPLLSALLNAWNLGDVYMGQETDWDNDIAAKASFGILLAGTIIIMISTCYDGFGRHRIIRKKKKVPTATLR